MNKSNSMTTFKGFHKKKRVRCLDGLGGCVPTISLFLSGVVLKVFYSCLLIPDENYPVIRYYATV